MLSQHATDSLNGLLIFFEEAIAEICNGACDKM